MARRREDGEPSAAARVLVVDRDPSIRRGVARALLAGGLDVRTAEDGGSAAGLLASAPADAVLLDVSLAGATDAGGLARIRGASPEVPIVLLAGAADVAEALRLVGAGEAYDVLAKPFAGDEAIAVAVARAVERARLAARVAELEDEGTAPREGEDEIAGSSSKIREVLRKARAVAPTSVAVLVFGEPGTGRRSVARLVHRLSTRARRPFIEVDCSALPAAVAERELFGALRGQGVLEEAAGGTVFLAEVGELPDAAQLRLLRLLEHDTTREVAAPDVRVVASVSGEPLRQVEAGKLRKDLYYRLAGVAIHVPALRQRKDDIPVLAYEALRRHASRAGRDIGRIGVEALRKLRAHAWPGNLRELDRAIEHAVVGARRDVILPADLPPLDGEDRPEREDGSHELRPLAIAELGELPYGEARRRVLAEFDRRYLEAALARSGGNVSAAARETGLDRSNFRRALKKAAPK